MNFIFTLLLKVNLLKQKAFKFMTVNLIGIHLFAVNFIQINVKFNDENEIDYRKYHCKFTTINFLEMNF